MLSLNPESFRRVMKHEEAARSPGVKNRSIKNQNPWNGTLTYKGGPKSSEEDIEGA